MHIYRLLVKVCDGWAGKGPTITTQGTVTITRGCDGNHPGATITNFCAYHPKPNLPNTEIITVLISIGRKGIRSLIMTTISHNSKKNVGRPPRRTNSLLNASRPPRRTKSFLNIPPRP